MATSNVAVVLAVVLVMELTTRPIWNYVASMESLRNAMLLTATQGSGDEDERLVGIAWQLFCLTNILFDNYSF